MRHYTQSRRAFLKQLAGAGALMAFPTIIPSRVLGANAPSKRIAFGAIGTGGQGTHDLKGFLDRPDTRFVAVCDVDRAHRETAKQIVDRRNGDTACAAYNDFRELLARPDIDAVLITTPENWHALITIAAAKAGKDIYCEKPFAATIAEGRAAADAVRRHGVVLQVGSQERSRAGGRFACELARNGYLGRLHTIRVNLPTDRRTCPPQPVQPVPEGFDYNLWLGPAPWEPYTTQRCHRNFRWIMDYSIGELIDRGAHVGDLAQWGNGTDLSGPIEIEGRGEFPTEGLWDTAIAYQIQAKYANGVTMHLTSNGPRGVRFEGDGGWVFYGVHGGELEASSPSLLKVQFGPNSRRLYNYTNNHQQNFINCIHSRQAPIAPAEAGHRTASLCYLANIALLTGRKLRWDPATERFSNDPTANAMIARPMRAPWTIS